MKKIYFLLIALCFFATTKAQIVNIPDANFMTKLLASSSSNYIAQNLSGSYFKIDANNDKKIQLSEALNVSYLNASNYNSSTTKITDLTGIQSFKNLKSLSCSENQLSSLDVFPLLNLTFLDCSDNQIKNLDVSPLVQLTYLRCGFNQLSSLDTSLLVNLGRLDCYSNQLTSLDVSSLVNLTSLSCENNQLTSLDVSLLVNLTYLSCGYNQLTTLKVSSLVRLHDLFCSDNQIKDLDIGNLTSLNRLECNNNLLTKLNVSGLKNLQKISLKNNIIDTINLDGLKNVLLFDCSNNKLTSLDFSGIEYAAKYNLEQPDPEPGYSINPNYILSDNELTSINLKNSNFFNVEFKNNFNLQYICVNDDKIQKIQNSITQYGYTNCSVNSYCSFTPGGTTYAIQGNLKLDSNANGCDVLDIVVPNLKFNITNGTTTGSLISNLSGSYSIPVLAGTHTIKPVIENPTYFTVSPTTVNVTFPAQTSPFTQNFCITPNGVRLDLEVTLLPLQPARPGFDAKYKIVYKNKGNQTQSGSVNLTFTDSVLDLVVANPVTSTQTTNNLSWNFTNLLPFETREITFTMNINSPMETPAVNNGDILAYTAAITSVAVDETPIDNTFALNQRVVNAFDPNDKTCLEGTSISSGLIGQYVHYMIRFENNGTANAQNIVVKDMIDLSKFDISTLVPTSASHSYTTRITAGNKVEFIFENINLPFDDTTNDGYISFKIKTLPTLVVNDTFTNEASIFFDYNFPILTNKATSTFKTLGTQDFEFTNYFTIYPNPVTAVLNITAKETIEVKSISIYNTLGQQILVIPNAQQTKQVDVSSLKTGNYFIKVTSNKGSASGKFVKE